MGGIEILAAASVISGIGSIVGGIGASKAAKSEGKLAKENAAFNAAIAQENADFIRLVGQRNADQALARTDILEDRLRRDRTRRISATRSAFARTGVGLSGTPLEALAGQAAQLEEEALLVRAEGEFTAEQAILDAEIRARNQELDALGFAQQGDVAAQVADNRSDAALIGGFVGGVSTALTGLGQASIFGDLVA